MAAEFRKHIKNFEEADLDNPGHLEIQVSEILVRDIKQECEDIIDG